MAIGNIIIHYPYVVQSNHVYIWGVYYGSYKWVLVLSVLLTLLSNNSLLQWVVLPTRSSPKMIRNAIIKMVAIFLHNKMKL